MAKPDKLLRVLVVEDSVDDAELTIYELTRAGYQLDWKHVDTREDYIQALDPDFDLILADYNLPNFTALEALHLLQQTDIDIPLIVITGSIEEVAIECMKQGAADYLLKDRLGRLEQAVERALEQKRLRDEKKLVDAALQLQNAELEALYQTSLEINAQPDLPTLLNTIITRAVNLLRAHMGGLYLTRPDGRSLELAVSYQLPKNYHGTIMQYGEGLSGRVAESGETITIDDYNNWAGRSPIFQKENLRRALGVPLKLGDRVIGVIITTDDQRVGGFSDEEIRLVGLFADQAAIAVENIRLLEVSQHELKERRRVEAALIESQRALATLMSNLPGMAYRSTFHPVWKMKFVSHGCLALTGYHPEEIIENQRIAYENIIFPDDVPLVRKEISTALTDGKSYQIIYRIITADGSIRWVWEQGRGVSDILSVDPDLDEDSHYANENLNTNATGILSNAHLPKSNEANSPVALEGFITDITSRINAEHALRDSEELFRQLAENVHDIFWVIEANSGRMIYISPAYESIIGRSRWSLMDAPLQLLKYVHRDDSEKVRVAVKRYLNGQEVNIQFRLLRPDREIRWVETRTYPIYDDNEKIYRWVGLAEDITERKNAENQQRYHSERIQMLDGISRSLTDIMHDYHNSLQSVARQIAEFLGDGCGIALLENDDQTLRINALHHVDPEADAFLRAKINTIPIDEPLPNQLFQHQEIIFWNNINPLVFKETIPEEYWPYLHRIGVDSLAAVALRAQGRIIGALAVIRDSGHGAYTNDDLALLQEAANRIALTVVDSQLYMSNLRQVDYLEALREIDLAITGSVDRHVVFKVILEKATTHLNVHAASLLTYDPHLQTLQYASGRGFHTSLIQRAQVGLGDNLAGKSVLNNDDIFIYDWADFADENFVKPQLDELFKQEGFVSYYAKPLRSKGETQGVLEIFHRDHLKPDQEWLHFLDSVTGQAAIAIDNANLLESLRQSNTELALAYNETIQGWSRALDLRDRETEGHTQRVTEMTVKLAHEMGIQGDELAHIRRGALLHDIGKMGIRDHILLKPGKLTEDEWVDMRKHPVYAYDMLAPIAYLRPALDIPYCHHEWWDGSGYPRGLAGEQIPLPARIFSVVDVWDAITYPRLYRPTTMTKEEAADHLKESAGIHFDPEVVNKFLEVFVSDVSGE